MKCRYLLPVVAVFVVPVLASAATTNRLTEVVVTSTRIPTEAENAPTAVTVLQGAELDRRQVRTVGEALREVPGLNVVQYGQPGGVTSVFIRGGNANHTLVLVDGIRVNNGFDSQFDFNNLPTDNVERIEVLRGPQSTLYGSEALGGVINIVTRRSAAQPTGAVTFEGGSYNSLRPRASFAATYGKLSLSGAASYFSSDNDRINSAVRQRDINASVRYQVLERLDVAVSGWYRSSHAGSAGSELWGTDPNDFLASENAAIAAVFHAQPFEVWDMRLTLSHNHDRKHWSGAPNYPGGDYSYAWTTTDRDQIDFQNLFVISERHKLVAGMSFDNVHANRVHDELSWWGGASSGTISHTTRSYAGYGQYEFTPTPRATFNAGLRVDSYNALGSELTYRVGARYTVPVTETILRANLGTGFRVPSLMDLYYPGYNNPDLQPERSIGWDVGFEQPLFDNKLRVGANYFQNQFDNLITYDPAKYMPMNVQKAETIGVESFATWTPLTPLTVRGSYTWLPTAEDQFQNRRLNYRPRHSSDVNVHYQFLKRFGAMFHTRVASAHNEGTVKSGSYFKMDLGLSYDVCKHFTVFGRIENLTDEQYAEVNGYPSLGRTLWGGGTIKF